MWPIAIVRATLSDSRFDFFFSACVMLTSIHTRHQPRQDHTQCSYCSSSCFGNTLDQPFQVRRRILTDPRKITTSSFFEDEQEEVREIAQRVSPNTHLIMIPPGLKAQEGNKMAVDYLVEQITELRLPASS